MAMCEMKGFLTFLVLRIIKKKSSSGEDIRQELEKRKGCKPSAGTIYPVLKYLKESALIEETSDGAKEKKYSLTDKGKKELELATRKFMRMFADVFEES